MVRRTPKFMGLSQYKNSKNASTSNVYFATGVSEKRKTYSGTKTVNFSKFFRMK
tara:strand:+ start:2087 stop:2248 length:162 start_codon:yes stop_codon:yes gene_type:complete